MYIVEAESVLPDVKRLLEMSQRVDIPFDDISQAIIVLVEEGKLSAEERQTIHPFSLLFRNRNRRENRAYYGK